MILDNRQVVPDIIVSRDGVPNNSIAYNINNNFQNNPDIRMGKPDGSSPRHCAKGGGSGAGSRAHDVSRHAYATGNNNGSPRHVPHNGNYYSETKVPPVHQRSEKVVVVGRGSPIFSRGVKQKPDKDTPNYGDSPHQSPHFERRAIEMLQRSPRHSTGTTGSPILLRRGNQRNFSLNEGGMPAERSGSYDNCIWNGNNKMDSPKRNNNSYKDSCYGSPVHHNHRGFTAKHYDVFCSPKRVPSKNHLFSPRKTNPLNMGRTEKAENPRKDWGPSVVHNEKFRPRSSSHPCEGTKFAPYGQSKIPVQIPKPFSRQNAVENDDKIQINDNEGSKFGSPCRNLNRKYNVNRNYFPRKDASSAEQQNLEYKRILKEYAIFSPKRVISRNRNQSALKFQETISDLKQSRRNSFDHKIWDDNKKYAFDVPKQWNGDTWKWNNDRDDSLSMDTSNSWNIENEQKSEEENDALNRSYDGNGSEKKFHHFGGPWVSSESVRGCCSDSEEDSRTDSKFRRSENEDLLDKEALLESEGTLGSKMVLIKCKDANYLTRIFVNNEGIHGLSVVGRVGVGGSAQGHVMSLDQPVPAAGAAAAVPGDLNSNHSVTSDDVTAGSGNDVINREALSENTGSLISQTTDTEFEHEAADYQWLLDYDVPPQRYRECYSRESLGGGRDGSARMSVLQHAADESNLSYETLSRNIDANLAEIDMDDFRSEDIHQLLSLPTICGDVQDINDDEMYCSLTGSLDNSNNPSPHKHSEKCLQIQQQANFHQQLLKQHQQRLLQQQQKHQLEEEEPLEENPSTEFEDEKVEDDDDGQQYEDEEDVQEEIEEEYSGVSGDVSLYQSGPLFSPLKDPPHIPPSFSVDSLDSDSIHEDLILTCQANKNNYTIAFEGSFIQYSQDSDYQETALSEGAGSGAWSTERLEGRSPAPNMTYSDQPYTTWSRVSRRSSQSQTPDPAQSQSGRSQGQSPLPPQEKPQQHQQHQQQQPQLSKISQHSSQHQGSKSNSMPNLMRKSLMRRSLETSGHCMKVYDLQNSLRSSQLSSTRSVDANNFSLMRLFIKQKSLSKEAVSLSSSCTDPSQEGACSSSENQSGVNDSSDWPMNSQSENDMDGSASPVPVNALNNHLVHDRPYRGRVGSPNIILAANQDNTAPTELNNTHTIIGSEGILNNNNLAHIVDNVNSNPIDNITSFEDSLKEPNPCSKPPMTSPIREEPEGMDISIDSRCENKVLLDQSEKETKPHEVLRLKDNNMCNIEPNNKISSKSRVKDLGNKNIQGNKNMLNMLSDDKKRSESPSTPKHQLIKKESLSNLQRKRQDSGNSSSGYVSNKSSTERIRRSSESDKVLNSLEKPKPKPRSLKQVTDQCLQTSNLKVSATVNTSGIMDKKEVYVYYPNYALPDLGFLKEKKYSVDARIFLVPQHYMLQKHDPRKRKGAPKRPFSCGDMEKLKKHGFGHVKDWDSLNFLLPKELKEMLLDDTECMETIKPSFCKPSKSSRRPTSNEFTQQKVTQDVKESRNSSSSLNSTQPSSGYRGSSTMLNDSGETVSPLDHRYVYRYENTSMDSDGGPPIPKRSISLPTDEQNNSEGSSGVNDTPPPRPPLPRGILRKCTSLRDDPTRQGSKRHSSGDAAASKVSMRDDLLKRRSLQEPVGGAGGSNDAAEKEERDDSRNIMGCSCLSECTGFCARGLRKKNLLLVDELPEVSSHEELTESDIARLRTQVSEFLATKGGQVGSIFAGDLNYPTCDCPRKSVSFAEKSCSHRQQSSNRNSSTPKKVQNDVPESKVQRKAASGEEELPPMLYDAHDKKTLVLSVRTAVEKLVMHFNKGSTQQDKNKLGTSDQTPEVAQLALDKLCPAIYALLSDGLLPSLHSLFGKISNSVWRVVEATSQMGPSTKALNDLVLTLNSEECLSEGPIKFNAFIFGLLNIRSLDAWLGYLRTRESALQKHYHPDSFLYLSNTATRGLYDDLLLALRPLAILPFRLDLLHEYKALHVSLLKMEERLALHSSQSPTDAPLDILLAAKESKEFRNAAARTTDRSRSPRPRSCHENTAGMENVQGALRKRWSGVQLGSKLVTAIDKLLTEEVIGTSSEDYTDSIDNPKRGNSVPGHKEHSTSDDVTSDMRVSDLSSRDGDVSERSATDKDTDNEKGLRLNGKNIERENESEGERFRRLQLKWEAMTGQNVSGQKATQKEEEQDKERAESITSPAGVQRSRIPRPVSITSPQQAFKPFELSREKTSPQVKYGKKQSPSTKDHPKPAPRRSLKDRVVPTDHHDSQPARGPAVRARVGGPRTPASSSNLSTIGSNRASSVPGRKAERGSSGSRLVQTLHHRLATDNGHLSFSRGDILTVIVEVDERFILCCLHDRKGLVPRSSVVGYHQ